MKAIAGPSSSITSSRSLASMTLGGVRTYKAVWRRRTVFLLRLSGVAFDVISFHCYLTPNMEPFQQFSLDCAS
jgi:hypothetical protein